MRKIAGVFVALLFVGACGGTEQFPTTAAKDAPKSAPAAKLLAAVDKTSNAKTASFTMREEMHDMPLVGGAAVNATGKIDFTNHKSEMTLTVQGFGSTETEEVRVIGDTAFTRKNGGAWQSEATGDDSSGDFGDYLSYLRGVADDVHANGSEKIRGVDTTRYDATVDLHKAIDRETKDPSTKARMQAALERLDATMPTSVWIDSDGRLRRFTMKFDLSSLSGMFGESATDVTVPGDASQVKPSIDFTMELFDFGTEVDVQAPISGATRPSATPTSVAPATGARARAQDRAAQSDLRNGLTVEKVVYTDDQEYSADTSTLAEDEGSLAWGTDLKVVVGDAVSAGDHGVVCLSERSASGTLFAIADVAAGPYAGTYFGSGQACSTKPSAVAKWQGW